MDAVNEYQARRKKRLDEKAIAEYLNRRDERLRRRFDEEEETNNKPKSGGHGNTKIPFGLCQREGIRIDPGWTPKDAWNALEGKGYKAGEVYKELKKTGKASKGSGRVKRPPTKIEAGHFPSAMMTASHKKNTMAFADYVSNHCDDGAVTEFLGLGSAPGLRSMGTITCRKSSSGEEASVTTSVYRDTGEIAGVKITVPNFSKIKDEEYKEQEIRSFAHEWTHFIDEAAAAGRKGAHFSAERKELMDAIDSDDGSYGDEVKEIFQKYNEGYDRLRKEESNIAKEARFKLIDERYPERPDWFMEDGWMDWMKVARAGKGREASRLFKELQKLGKEIAVENKQKRRAYMNGAVSLQGLYDSLSSGKLRESGDVKFGHPRSYFRDKGNKAVEVLADYVSLVATGSPYVEVFRRDKPEIAKQLDDTIEEIIRKVK